MSMNFFLLQHMFKAETDPSVKYGTPADTRRNNNVIMTSKRRRGVVLTS